MTGNGKERRATPLLSVQNAVKHFGVARGILPGGSRAGAVQAVDGISLEIGTGETVGLVGESGCGKSTLARLILRLERPDRGVASFAGGDDVFRMNGKDLKAYRRGVQMVFQDPYSSLNPRISIGRSIMRAWENNRGSLPKSQWRAKSAELLQLVGMGADRVDWYPHQLSGGQRQRVAIARALALGPRLVVCDEPVSALDLSIQAQILALLEELQGRLGVSYLFISHDLDVVRRIADRVVVMYLGRIVEQGTAEDVFTRTSHPYTQALLAAVPSADFSRRSLATRQLLQGDPPNPANPPSGCRFRSRCPKAQPVCSQVDPALLRVHNDGHKAACHFADGASFERKQVSVSTTHQLATETRHPSGSQ